MRAGETPPQQIVAVVRPASFISSKVSKKLDQKDIVKMDEDMLMEVEFQDTDIKSKDKNTKLLYSHHCLPTSRSGFHGLYIFPLESKLPNMFNKAGIYIFCFSIVSNVIIFICHLSFSSNHISNCSNTFLSGKLDYY